MATYQLRPTLPSEAAAALNAYPPLLAELLYQRGITNAEAAAAFLTPSYEEQLHDPFLLHDMSQAVDRLLVAITKGERIAIYSDYDCDGIPGGVILHDFLMAIGHTNFENYIPHRHYDGFGFHAAAVTTLAERGASLIVTVDCGTTAVAAVEQAQTLGLDVIITDHHQPDTTLPAAVAIVNPQLGDYPFRGLCGAAVVYKLILALLNRGSFNLSPGREKWWLDMVGLATVADLVPLTGENRVLAHFGLTVLRQTRRPGLLELLRLQRVNPRTLSEDDIGFTIGPRVNAASRMDSPEVAFSMLTTTDLVEAATRVAHLERLNSERKGTVAAMTRQAHEHLRSQAEVPAVIVLGDPLWRPALVGLVANTLAEEHARPAFVWGRDGNGVIKGSARSGGQVNVYALMETTAEHFIEFGGHHFSGGFSVTDNLIHSLGQKLNTAYQQHHARVVETQPLLVDYTTRLDQITTETLKVHRALAPFGIGNEKPLLRVETVIPERVERFGKGKEHLKLVFKTRGLAREAIAFFRSPEQFSVTPEIGKTLNLIAHLEESSFAGRSTVRLRLVDIC